MLKIVPFRLESHQKWLQTMAYIISAIVLFVATIVAVLCLKFVRRRRGKASSSDDIMLLEFTNDEDYPSEAVNMLYEEEYPDKNNVTQI